MTTNNKPEYIEYTEQVNVPEYPTMILDTGPVDGFSIWVAAMILKMSIIVAFALTTWVSLRLLDWLNGKHFREWLNSADDNNKALYYSVRFAAVVIGSAIVFAFGGGL